MPEITVASDRSYWLNQEIFLAYFDQEDFLCRDSQVTTNAYLSDWFLEMAEGRRFILPAVQLIGGRTQFINGRHRTAVLFNYMNEIPIAVTRVDREGEELFSCLLLRPLDMNESIELPNLPIREKL